MMNLFYFKFLLGIVYLLRGEKMQPYDEVVVSIKNKRKIKLHLLPKIKTSENSAAKNVTIRDVTFATKKTKSPSKLLLIPDCFILGKRNPWLSNFKFLENYNQHQGVLIVSMPKIAAAITITDEENNIFNIKSLGEFKNYKDLGDYKIVQCNIGRMLKYAIRGKIHEKPLKVEESKKVWPGELLVQMYTVAGNKSDNNPYTSLKFRILQINFSTTGKQ